MKYFSSDSDGNVAFHQTEKEARDAAAECLEWATDGDTDEDAVSLICWGVVKGAPVQTKRISREEAFARGPEDEERCIMQRNGWDFLVAYEMRDEPEGGEGGVG